MSAVSLVLLSGVLSGLSSIFLSILLSSFISVLRPLFEKKGGREVEEPRSERA